MSVPWGRLRISNFVQLAFSHNGDEQLPHACVAAAAHWVDATIPLVELAHHTHPFGIRRPHGKQRAGDAVDRPQVRSLTTAVPGSAGPGETVISSASSSSVGKL